MTHKFLEEEYVGVRKYTNKNKLSFNYLHIFYLKYPAWLDEKKSTLPSNVHENYSTQYKLVCEICSEYEKENEKDTDEVKKRRFDKLMGLMQKVGNALSNR